MCCVFLQDVEILLLVDKLLVCFQFQLSKMINFRFLLTYPRLLKVKPLGIQPCPPRRSLVAPPGFPSQYLHGVIFPPAEFFYFRNHKWSLVNLICQASDLGELKKKKKKKQL